MQHQTSLEPNAVMITTTDDVSLAKEEQSGQGNALGEKIDLTPSTAISLSPKSLPKKMAMKNKPVIPPHKKDTRKLFVGGLGKQVNNENFKQFFEQYGAVIDSIVMIDRETNRHRGFGFVTFQDPDVAQKVLCMGNEGQAVPDGGWKSGKIEILGKVCEVKASEPKKGEHGHFSSCKSSCSSESSGGLLVPSNIQFQKYYSHGGVMQQQGIDESNAGYYNNVVPYPMGPSSYAPFSASVHQDMMADSTNSATTGMDGYSSVLNMGQVNPIPSNAATGYPNAAEMYYPGSYPPCYYYAADHDAMCHPYFYPYEVPPDSTNIHGAGALPANYYYPTTANFVGNQNYSSASYYYPSAPSSLYNERRGSPDYATTNNSSITNDQHTTRKKPTDKKIVKSGDPSNNEKANEQKV